MPLLLLKDGTRLNRSNSPDRESRAIAGQTQEAHPQLTLPLHFFAYRVDAKTGAEVYTERIESTGAMAIDHGWLAASRPGSCAV